jgi:Phosphate-selective porin O and P
MGITSADGDYSLSLHMLLQTKLEHVESDRTREDGFRVVLARPALRGVAFRKWLSYFVQWELAGGSASLLDAEIVAQPIPEIGLKVGQFLTPFSREFLVPPGALLFPDFSPSNVLFRANRDTGAMLLGRAFDGRLEYYAAGVNGNGINRGGNDNAQLEWVGRVAVNAIGVNPYTETPQLVTPEAGLAVGVNASYADMEQTATTVDPATGATTVHRLGSSPTTKLGADVAFHAGPLSLQVEGYTRSVQAVSGGRRMVARGGFAQAGFFVIARTLEIAARGDLIDLDAAGGKNTSSALEKRLDGGVAWYVRDNHLKLQARYAWADSPNGASPSPKGTSNTVTLQAQLWF